MNQDTDKNAEESEKLKIGMLIQLTLKMNAIEQLLIKNKLISEDELMKYMVGNYSKFKKEVEKSLELK
jgi:hypothetical protein